MSGEATDWITFWRAYAADVTRRVFVDVEPDADGHREHRLRGETDLHAIDRMMCVGCAAAAKGDAKMVVDVMRAVDERIACSIEARRLVNVVAEFRFATEQKIYDEEARCLVGDDTAHEVHEVIIDAFAAADSADASEVERLMGVVRHKIEAELVT